MFRTFNPLREWSCVNASSDPSGQSSSEPSSQRYQVNRMTSRQNNRVVSCPVSCLAIRQKSSSASHLRNQVASHQVSCLVSCHSCLYSRLPLYIENAQLLRPRNSLHLQAILLRIWSSFGVWRLNKSAHSHIGPRSSCVLIVHIFP